MKRKVVSNDTLDPGLSRGWAYFVEDTSYRSYLEKYLNEPQPVRRLLIACESLLILCSRKAVAPVILPSMQLIAS